MLKDKRRAALRIDFLHILAPSSPCGGQALPHSASSDKPSEPVLNQALLSQPASLCSAQHLTHHLTSALSPASKKHGSQQKGASPTPNPQTSCVYMHLRAFGPQKPGLSPSVDRDLVQTVLSDTSLPFTGPQIRSLVVLIL